MNLKISPEFWTMVVMSLILSGMKLYGYIDWPWLWIWFPVGTVMLINTALVVLRSLYQKFYDERK